MANSTGAELVDPILDVLRGQVESSDSFQGFQLLHCGLETYSWRMLTYQLSVVVLARVSVPCF